MHQQEEHPDAGTTKGQIHREEIPDSGLNTCLKPFVPGPQLLVPVVRPRNVLYRWLTSVGLLLLAAPVLQAQFDSGLPFPIPKGRSSREADKSEKQKVVKAEGTVRTVNAGSLVLDAADGRILTLKLTRQTKFQEADKTIEQSAVAAGAAVQIEASQDKEGNFTATVIILTKRRAAETAKAEEQPEQEETVLIDTTPSEAPGRPVLRRGKPSPRPKAEEPEDAPIAVANNSAVQIESDAASEAEAEKEQALLARTREWVESFSEALPNYVCQQFTTRYQYESKQTGWRALDMVSATVVYDNGKEEYRDIAINGKKMNKAMMDLPGTRSAGEFGSTLRSLFSKGRAQFRYSGVSRISGAEAATYDYSVVKPNSDWKVEVGSQAIVPAFSGRVWIDPKTAHVLRIEMQADDVPQEFPLDKIELTVDYQPVRLSTASFLLPIRAENLACERGTTLCSRNTIEFRNYRKYAGESTITFDEK